MRSDEISLTLYKIVETIDKMIYNRCRCIILSFVEMIYMMDINKLIEFTNNEFPREGTNISAAIDLLLETIDQVNRKITSLYQEYSTPKDRDKFDLYRNTSLELYDLAKTLSDFMEKLTPDFDLTDVEADTNDDIDELLDAKDESKKQKQLLRKFNIDYNDKRFNANQTEPHSLYEDFTHTRPCAFEINGNRIEVMQWRELLAKTCGYLFSLEGGKDKFEEFIIDPNMNGDSRKYFSHNKEEIAEPQRIAKSDIFVIGNVSAVFARNLTIRLLNKFGISKNNYKVFIYRDLSSLHNKNDLIKKQEKELEKNKNIAVDSELKIGKYARSVFSNLFKSEIAKDELANMQERTWSHEELGLDYPLLRKKISGVSDYEQTKDGNGNNRYYKSPILINGEEYFLCSQWFENKRSILDNWISLRGDENVTITRYYKIIHGMYSVVIEEEILKILLEAIHTDYLNNNVIAVRRIRADYDDIIAENTKYRNTPQTVLYTLIGRLTDMGIIKLVPNCQKGKYIIEDNSKFLKIIEDCRLIEKVI